LAVKYERSIDAIHQFASRNKDEIRLAKQALIATPSDEYMAIAIARKMERIADADQDWENIKEILQDPNLSPSQRKGYLLLKSKLRHKVAEERGELPVRAQFELEAGPRLVHEVVGWSPEKWASGLAGPEGRGPTRKDVEAVDPFRAMSPPPPPVEPATPVVEPEPPPVPDYVQQAAEALALKVRATGSTSRARLFGARPFMGIHPTTAEEYLNHAVHLQWVTIDGDQIAPGAVDPNPKVTTRIHNF
jgi:hypothetical protein